MLAATAGLGAAGCGGAPLVDRAYEGHVVEGRPIEAAAYAAFLNGAIAEASGDRKAALAEYERAAASDPAGPEIWARIGAVRCASDPRDARADDALSRALSLDPGYAGAWTAKARCQLARKDAAGATAAARRAAALDPSADGANALLARAGEVRDPASRDALVALTETARDRVAAWDALASWASAHGDVALWARALERLARIASSRRAAVAQAAEELAGSGEISEARDVAAAAVDGGDGPFDAAAYPLAARLAVDEAITTGDAKVVELRATRARVSLEEAGGRAWLAGQRDLARAIAGTVAAADPGAGGAALVVAASGGDIVGAASDARAHKPRASAAAALAFGTAAAHGLSPEDWRATMSAIAREPIVPGDDRVVRPAVELASRGVLEGRALPPDAQVELAVLHVRAGGEGPALPDTRGLDARHEYLALAMAQPQSRRARELGERLAGAVAGDPIVAAAAAMVQIASGSPIAAGAARALLMRDPRDPLLAATALRMATKTGDSDVASLARETLAAF